MTMASLTVSTRPILTGKELVSPNEAKQLNRVSCHGEIGGGVGSEEEEEEEETVKMRRMRGREEEGSLQTSHRWRTTGVVLCSG